MLEVLKFIFSSFWVWSGTCFLIMSFGWSMAVPFRALYLLKQFKKTRRALERYSN